MLLPDLNDSLALVFSSREEGRRRRRQAAHSLWAGWVSTIDTLVLFLPQGDISSLRNLQQLLMSSSLNDLATVHDQDLISIHDRGEPMGDDNHRTIVSQSIQ
jgi:hypothetical protein